MEEKVAVIKPLQRNYSSRAKLEEGTTHKQSERQSANKNAVDKKRRNDREKRECEICRIPIKAACPPEPCHQLEERFR